MDPSSLLNDIRHHSTLKRAFEYALYDRKRDAYSDFFELDHAHFRQENILNELQEELATPETY